MTATALSEPHAHGAPSVSRRARLSPVLWTLPPLALLAGFLIYPLALVLRQSFTGGDGASTLEIWRSVLSAGEFHRAIGNTITIAVAASKAYMNNPDARTAR